MAEHDMESILLETPGFKEILKFVDSGWWYYPTAPPSDEKEKKPELDIEESDEMTDLAGRNLKSLTLAEPSCWAVFCLLWCNKQVQVFLGLLGRL